MKRKWWIALGVALVAAVCVFSFREALMVRLFPRAVLSRAISGAFEELETRFADSPMHPISDALDSSGCQNVKLNLDTSTGFMGVAHYDLDLQTQANPNRILGQGNVSTGSGIIDLKLYLDEDFAALSSDSLTGGTYYGINYDSFSTDIREFPLLGFLAGEDTLTQWAASVAEIAELMAMELTLPEISAADIRMALLGTLVLKPQVAAEEGRHCYTITFTAPVKELLQMAQPYLEQAPENLVQFLSALEADPNASLKLAFRLETRKLTALTASLNVAGTTHDAQISMTGNLLRGEWIYWDGQNLDRREMTIQTVSDEYTYQEKLVFSFTRNGVQNQLSAEYAWDLSSGDMALEIVKDGKKYPIRLNLQGEGASITVTCREFEKVSSLLTGKDKDNPAICTMILSPGSPVPEVLDYRNISEWSMEDLLLLLKNIGGLIGIKMP